MGEPEKYFLFLSDKRLRAALTTLFGMYEGKIFGAVVAHLVTMRQQTQKSNAEADGTQKKNKSLNEPSAPPITKILIKLNVFMA